MESLKQERGALRAQLTRFKTFIKRTQEAIAVDNAVLSNKQIISEIKVRRDTISELLSRFEKLHIQITINCQNANEEEDILEDFENTYFAQISAANEIIERFSKHKSTDDFCKLTADHARSGSSSSNHSAVSNDSNQNSYHNNQNSKHHINLPKIHLSKFNGQIDSWLEFKSLFYNLIHENDKLNEIQKLHYLKASLTGEASAVISSLDFRLGSYDIAMEALCSRYDKPKSIIKNHLNFILELETQTKESSHALRKINDSLTKHISAAKSMATSEQLFETIIVHLVTNKLAFGTMKEWEVAFNKSPSILPSLDEFKEFLNSHANLLENIEKRQPKVANNNKFTHKAKSFVGGLLSCTMCDGNHYIQQCEKFIALDTQARVDEVQKLKLCFNCLSNNHSKYQCKSKYTCRICRSRHHTLLHAPVPNLKVTNPAVVNTATVTSDDESVQTISAFCATASHVLLPTASAKVLDASGIFQTVRILLDSGSQSNFIRSDVCQRMRLPLQEANISITGINNTNTRISSMCNLELSAHHSSFKTNLSCLVIDEITGSVPSFNLKQGTLKIPCNIRLSDTQFNKPGKIDILIGSPTFFELLCGGKVKLGRNLPILQETQLGWIIAGPTNTNVGNHVQCLFNTQTDLQTQMSRFWEIDHYPTEKVLSTEESKCEAHFIKNTRRNNEGRFIVSIPLKEQPSVLGDSLTSAQKQFISLERRLRANPNLERDYHAFIREYLDLGHMSLSDKTIKPSYYLPHHGVHKASSLTTKLRVVFNGSFPTTSGQSLNSIQMIGPTIQEDLFTILIRFRQHTYAVSADIEKMYRQVEVEPNQRPLQRILWRFSQTSPIEHYDLNTITYGTASASYLAIRSLNQLGIECEETLPKISQVIKRDFYVDDLLSGGSTIKSAREICSQTAKVLNAGCFKLRKWISNDPKVLRDIPKEDVHPGILVIGDREQSSTLGLTWLFQTDHFMVSMSDNNSSSEITKRQMLSEISKIFDPLGLFTPCTFIAKAFMQKLWVKGLNWDDPIPTDMEKRWLLYKSELSDLKDLKIPRHVTCVNPISIQIHGFCDASTEGYGACIYMRSESANHIIHTNLFVQNQGLHP